MKKVLPFIFFLSAYCHAQKITYKMGEQVQIDKEDNFYFIGHDETNFYIVRTEKQKSDKIGYLEGFSRNTMGRVFSTLIEVPIKNTDEYKIYRTVFVDNVARVFYGYFDKKEKIQYLSSIDYTKAGTVVSEAKVLATRKELPGGGGFHIYFSDETKNTAVFFAKKKKGNIYNFMHPEMDVYVFDKSLHVLLNKPIILTELSGINITDALADNKGNLFIKCELFDSKVSPLVLNDFKRTDGFTFYNNATGSLVFRRAEIDEDVLIQTGRFVTSPNYDIYFAGRVANSYRENSGIYIAAMNKEVVDLSMQKISPFLNNNEKDPGRKKKKEPYVVKLTDYYINDLRFDHSGRLRLSLENITSSPEGTIGYYKEMTDLRFNDSLQIASMPFVTKNQAARHYNNYQGMMTLLDSNFTVFLFNDYAENVKKTDDDCKGILPADANNGKVVPCLAKIDKEGNVVKEVLIDAPARSHSKYGMIRPRKSYNISENELISVYETDYKINFIQLKLE